MFAKKFREGRETNRKGNRKNQEQVAMSSAQKSGSQWGHSYRLTASEKWKAKSAAMGRDATDVLVDYARPTPGMKILDLASGTGEPAITIASRIGPRATSSRSISAPSFCRSRKSGLASVT